MTELVKVVVTVPESHADDVRQAIGDTDGGRIGNYTYCSFSMKGVGRFKPENGAQPAIGQVDTLEEVIEERIEVTCEKARVTKIMSAIKSVHPYEEIAIDIYPLLHVGENA